MGDGVEIGGARVSVAGSGVSVASRAVSVAVGGGSVLVGEGKGVGVAEARGVREGRISAIEVGDRRTPDVSSWLNRKLPKSIPTLMNVMAKLPSTCATPVAWPLVALSSLGLTCWAGVGFPSREPPGAGPNKLWALGPSRCCLTVLSPTRPRSRRKDLARNLLTQDDGRSREIGAG